MGRDRGQVLVGQGGMGHGGAVSMTPGVQFESSERIGICPTGKGSG